MRLIKLTFCLFIILPIFAEEGLPEGATPVSTDRVEVKDEAILGYPILKGVTIKIKGEIGTNLYVGRVCSSYFYIGHTLTTAHFIDVFAPYRITKLDFDRLNSGSSHSDYKHNDDSCIVADSDYEDWTPDGFSRVCRAPTSHLCYWQKTPGYTPLHCFTTGYVGHPDCTVRKSP